MNAIQTKLYKDPPTIIKECLENLRPIDANLKYSDQEIAEATGLSRWQVQRFRSTDREKWGGRWKKGSGPT